MLKLDMAALAKNEWVPDYESWHYSLAFAKVSLADSKSAEEVRKCISNMGYVVKEITELLSERRPSMVLSGLLKGATADCSKEDLSVIMKSAAAKNSIAGRIEVTECLKTKNGNAILRIRVDDIALKRIRELNMELRLATAGKVRFSEANKVQVVSRQKLNSNRENIVLYSINLDVFSIAIEFLTTNDLDSGYGQHSVAYNIQRCPDDDR